MTDIAALRAKFQAIRTAERAGTEAARDARRAATQQQRAARRTTQICRGHISEEEALFYTRHQQYEHNRIRAARGESFVLSELRASTRRVYE